MSNDLIIKLTAEKSARIAALEAQVDALTASPAPDPAANALGEVRQAMTAYHLALDRRQHGGVAAGAFVDAVSDILDMPWRQGAALAALPKGGA